ncbi:glycosyltransferase [Nocardioides flavescens]|uniref:glycosyltransferase n=1 Tax=Nocardioides flavescens TaxID=2691959 RepID=UPI0019268434
MSLTLLVANDGGHLKQLHSLSSRLPTTGDRLWVTIESPQTRSLLAGEDVEYLLPSKPRDVWVAARNAVAARRILRSRDIELVVSTGSSLAAAVLPVAALHRIPTVYVESATRIDGPSFTGKILARLPGIRTLTQQRHWNLPGWSYTGSIFDGFEAAPESATGDEHAPSGAPAKRVERVVVTVGTSEHYGFRRLVERLVAVLPPDVHVTWQTGSTDVSDLPVTARASMPASELVAEIAEADAVIAHAGTGSSLVALEQGKMPLLVPRRSDRGEHVDDHQHQIASDLSSRGLAHVVDADELAWADVEHVAAQRISRLSSPPALQW